MLRPVRSESLGQLAFEKLEQYILSGNIKINENGLWLNVADSIYSRKIHNYSNKLFHLITTSSKIQLNNITISDYLECHDIDTNNIIDTLVEKYNNNLI